jgi:hypothetical protein
VTNFVTPRSLYFLSHRGIHFVKCASITLDVTNEFPPSKIRRNILTQGGRPQGFLFTHPVPTEDWYAVLYKSVRGPSSSLTRQNETVETSETNETHLF